MPTPIFEPTVFKTFQTRANRKEVDAWLSHLGVEDGYVDRFEDATDAELAVALPAKRCYNSFAPGLNENVTRVRDDLSAYIENILESRHGSTLEHATWTFAIEGVTRVLTAELNRHRAGVAISEASMRYIRNSSLSYLSPPSIQSSYPSVPLVVPKHDLKAILDCVINAGVHRDDAKAEMKSLLARTLLDETFASAEDRLATFAEIYSDELAPGAPFHRKKEITSMIRRTIPQGVCTGIVYTFNVRALRHVLEIRSSPSAEEEAVLLCGVILKRMAEDEPRLFGDFEKVNGFWRPKYSKV